jgi:hypothetical protein
MAILFKSLKNIYASNSKKDFILSLFAVSAWLIAMVIAIFSDTLTLQHGNLMIIIFLAVSVFFSVNAIPRAPRGKIIYQAVASKKELHEH